MKKYLLLAIAGILSVSVSAFGAEKKTLHADVFGNVYVGDSPHSVGKVGSSGRAGALRTDVFGNVYVGDSPFSVGKVRTNTAGPLAADAFGNVYPSDSPWSVGTTKKESDKYLPFLNKK